jgi:hypothetical protein
MVLKIDRRFLEGDCFLQRFRRFVVNNTGLVRVREAGSGGSATAVMTWDVGPPPGGAGDEVAAVDASWLDGFRESESFGRRDARQLLEEVRTARSQALAWRSFAGDEERRRAIQLLNGDLRRTARVMVQASQVAQGEGLQDTQRAVVAQAAGYHNVAPGEEFVLHGLESSRAARRAMAGKGRSEEEIDGVCRVVKEHIPPAMDDELPRYVARLVFESADYRPPLRELLLEALDKSEEDYRALVDFIERAKSHSDLDPARLTWLLYKSFGRTILTFPRPSSREAEILQDAVKVGQAHAQSLFSGILPGISSVGTVGGSDYDFALVQVPFVSRLRIAIGPIDLFVNDPNAAAAVEASQALKYVMEHNPALYYKWLNGKALAKRYLVEGVITKEEYDLWKAEWHSRRGLPDSHYRWKAADATLAATWPQDLRDALDDGLGRLSAEYRQVVNALHDADLLALLDPRSLHGYFDLWERAIAEGITALYENGAEKALCALRTETGRAMAQQNLALIYEFRDRYAAAARQKGREPPLPVAHRMLDYFLESRAGNGRGESVGEAERPAEA